jgi:hypothetical protein
MPGTKKRTFGEAFGQHTYENDRYGGEITDDYFMKGGVGHGVYSDPLSKTTSKAISEAISKTTETIKYPTPSLKNLK